MKTIINMTMSEMMNFDRDVINYINDNLQYIKENADATMSNGFMKPDYTYNQLLASEALEHYCDSVEASNDEESYLSEEQTKRFFEVAKRLFDEGFVEHSGILNQEL